MAVARKRRTKSPASAKQPGRGIDLSSTRKKVVRVEGVDVTVLFDANGEPLMASSGLWMSRDAERLHRLALTFVLDRMKIEAEVAATSKKQRDRASNPHRADITKQGLEAYRDEYIKKHGTEHGWKTSACHDFSTTVKTINDKMRELPRQLPDSPDRG
jgi:hypothetical protein